MLKRGFTLAEVLITLMIIGVVATLTTPALVKNVGSSKIGPQLAKFVNTWETAAEQLMAEESVGSLRAAINEGKEHMKDDKGSSTGTLTTTSNLLDVMSKYMIMSSLKGVKNPSALIVKSASGKDTLLTENFSDGYVWQLKDGTIIAYAHRSYLLSANCSKWLDGYLYVDIGGIKGQHRAGKEVFRFVMTDEGYLVPYGSNAFNSKKSAGFKRSCNHNGTSDDQFACTGAVADNGYKAPW